MSQELVLVCNCDVCQREDKIKVSEGVEPFSITINGVTREIDLCATHQYMELTIEQLRDRIMRYGRKPLKPEADKEPEGMLHCQCGKAFSEVRGLNSHIGQMKSKRPKEKHEQV